MKEFDDIQRDEYGNSYEHGYFDGNPDDDGPDDTMTKVCATCKHFYTRIDKGDGNTSGLDEYDLHVSPYDARNAEETRLCYEFHWCNAASSVCDDDFEPLGCVDSQSEDKPRVDVDPEQMLDKYRELLGVAKPKPQKEIQYVYVGLLKRPANGDNDEPIELIEVPTEIDGVATNYRRVEMGPTDWELYWKSDDNEIRPANSDEQAIQCLNIAENHAKIRFPNALTDWNNVEYFGLYKLAVGGNIGRTAKLNANSGVPIDVASGTALTFPIGTLRVMLEHLTDNHKKKGGE